MVKKSHRYMKPLDAAAHLNVSQLSSLFIFTVATLVVIFFIWASWAQVERLVRGEGRVVPAFDISPVQSLEGGILSAINVREGEVVKQGDVVARLSDITFASEKGGIEARMMGFRAKQARLKAEAENTPLIIPEDISSALADNEIALYNNRRNEMNSAQNILREDVKRIEANLAEIRAERRNLAKNKALLEEELSITSTMVAQKAAPKLEEIRLQRELNAVTGNIATSAERIKSLDAELAGKKSALDEQQARYRSNVLRELSEVETNIQALQEGLKPAEDRLDRTALTAPINGVIDVIHFKSLGSVIEPGKTIMDIVPTGDKLVIQANVKPSEIAFLRVGQPVLVKITAYDPQKYGGINGRLTRIGANSIQDRHGNVFFEIEVETDTAYIAYEDQKLPITTGMVAQTEVITGKRTILSYLLKPFLKARDRAMREI